MRCQHDGVAPTGPWPLPADDDDDNNPSNWEDGEGRCSMADVYAEMRKKAEKAEANARACATGALLDRYTESVKVLHYNAHGVDPATVHMLGADVDLWTAVEILREEILNRINDS